MKREELKYFYATDGEVGTMPLLHNIFVYPKEDVDHLLDEKDAKIESLKAKLEDAMATVAFNYLDAVTRERRLRRALWLARAEFARSSALSYHLIEDHPNKDVAETYKREANKWEKVKDKCLKRAELYK